MIAAEWIVVAKALAIPVGIVLAVVFRRMIARNRRFDAERAAHDAAKRAGDGYRHASGVVLRESPGAVLRERGDDDTPRRGR